MGLGAGEVVFNEANVKTNTGIKAGDRRMEGLFKALAPRLGLGGHRQFSGLKIQELAKDPANGQTNDQCPQLTRIDKVCPRLRNVFPQRVFEFLCHDNLRLNRHLAGNKVVRCSIHSHWRKRNSSLS